MKKFTAGSKAKTVQLADFKCSVCPLDVQIEKLLPKQCVCGRGRDSSLWEMEPTVLWTLLCVSNGLQQQEGRRVAWGGGTVMKGEGTRGGSTALQPITQSIIQGSDVTGV